MAQPPLKHSAFERPRYENCKVEALKVLRDAANAWAEGNPEDPTTEDVLDRMLAPFLADRFLVLPNA